MIAVTPLLEQLADRLAITRALCVLDCETTGTNPELDRIVEISVARIEPDTRKVTSLSSRVNPNMAIPAEASAVHGITDADVAASPLFAQLAPMVERLLAGADLVSFNGRRFDSRLVAAELKRCQRPDPCQDARHIDVQQIYFQREPRTLEAAVRFFCGVDHEEAHGATGDVVATLQVLLAQFRKYDDLPADVAALDALGRDPSHIDRDGKFAWKGGKPCINFGQHQGVPLQQADRGFLTWMLKRDFSDEAKAIARDALSGTYPAAPPQPVAGAA